MEEKKKNEVLLRMMSFNLKRHIAYSIYIIYMLYAIFRLKLIMIYIHTKRAASADAAFRNADNATCAEVKPY